MDSNIDIGEKQEEVPPTVKVSPAGLIKSRLISFKDNFGKFVSDPKNRKVVILAGALFLIVVFVVLAVVAAQLFNRPKEVGKGSPTVVETPQATSSPETIDSKLKFLRDELNLGFEDRSLLPPQIEFDIEF
ncbi:hypothetical protein A2125_02065 [Candidatus Woesebacteria bacterium GWB1_43_5]|uniref:Uncharacterized protein n=1 Tax=Candidatus Woesebacteria bacterium GWB1_43_5 TaxID=1802474 RepID=A0A1F7WRF3_9BACT|nr:MAG: hypothetical protein A2125_02065 [Candidatus Woesebacteria bacterium GWB1_43_5]